MIEQPEKERDSIPTFDAVLRQDRTLPTMTRWRWLNVELPRPLRWLLDNPAAARAIAHEAERRAAQRTT